MYLSGKNLVLVTAIQYILFSSVNSHFKLLRIAIAAEAIKMSVFTESRLFPLLTETSSGLHKRLSQPGGRISVSEIASATASSQTSKGSSGSSGCPPRPPRPGTGPPPIGARGPTGSHLGSIGLPGWRDPLSSRPDTLASRGSRVSSTDPGVPVEGPSQGPTSALGLLGSSRSGLYSYVIFRPG